MMNWAHILVRRLLLTVTGLAMCCAWHGAVAEDEIQFALGFEDVTVESGPVLEPPPESLPSPGDEQCGLTLAQAEALALGQHPGLSAANAEVRAARGRWVQVGLRPNPKIGYRGDDIGNEGNAGKQGGFVSQEFVTAGKLGLSREVAAQEVAQAERRAWQVELQVLTRVRTSFYQALIAQRSLEVAARVRKVAQQGHETAERLERIGEGTKVGQLQARIQLESAEIVVQQARNRKDAAWRALAAAIGAPDMCPQDACGDLEATLPDIDWQTAFDRVLAESPELAELEVGIDRARWAVERARAGRVPNVTVQSGVQYDDITGDTVAGVQVSVPLPVFNRNQGNLAAAQAEVSAARGAVLNKQLELQRRLAVAFERLQTSRTQVERYRNSIVPSAAESLELVQRAYPQELGYLDFLNAQRVYLQTNLEYLDALAEFWKNWAAIEGLVVNVPAQ